MKALPMPDGHELRMRRADKANNGQLWLPEDALYDASTAIEKPAIALVVAWYEKLDSGNHTIKYRIWQEYPRASVALAADLMTDLST